MSASCEDPQTPHPRLRVVDETLAHQIVLRHGGVSCNCRRIRSTGSGQGGQGRAGQGSHEFFAPLGTADEALAAHDNPANHRGTYP